MFTSDDKNGFSYFLNINTNPLAVVCPGTQLLSINDSCYVDITDEVKKISESHDVNYSKEKCSYPSVIKRDEAELQKRLVKRRQK